MVVFINLEKAYNRYWRRVKEKGILVDDQGEILK